MIGPLELRDTIVGFNPFAERKRDYKIFTVLKKSGEVTSMRIRELAAT